MSRTKDWVERSHEDFYRQVNQTLAYVALTRMREVLGMTPGTPLGVWFDDELMPKLDVFNAAWGGYVHTGDRSPVIVARLHEARGVLTKDYRRLYAGVIRKNPLVEDNDLVSMGLPVIKGHRSVPVKPDSYPVAVAFLPSPAVIELKYEDSETGKKAKPHGVRGAVIAWAILDHIPVDWSELVNVASCTVSHIRLTFSGYDRGKYCYFALCWENRRGKRGPWSNIRGAIVP